MECVVSGGRGFADIVVYVKPGSGGVALCVEGGGLVFYTDELLVGGSLTPPC